MGKGVIKIVYDADGNKLQRTYTATGSTVTSVTTYVNQFVHTETVASNSSSTIPLGGWGAGTDTLRYINFEEGRIRLMQPVSQGNGFDALVENGNLVMPNSMMGVYDYFIMDYQKNVRMILTVETHLSSITATMETARAPIEDGNGAQLVIPNINAPKNGYTYVYVSNQRDQVVFNLHHNKVNFHFRKVKTGFHSTNTDQSIIILILG